MFNLETLNNPQLLQNFIESQKIYEKNIIISGVYYSFAEIFFEGHDLIRNINVKLTFKIVSILINTLETTFPIRLGYLLYNSSDETFKKYMNKFKSIYQKLSLDSVIMFFPQTIYREKGQSLEKFVERLTNLLTEGGHLIDEKEIFYMLIYYWYENNKYPQRNYGHLSQLLEKFFDKEMIFEWNSVKEINLVWDYKIKYLCENRLDYFIINRDKRKIIIEGEGENNFEKSIKILN